MSHRLTITKKTFFFFFFFNYNYWKKKPYVQKKGHGGKTETNVQSHNRLSVRRLEMKSADRFSVLVLRRTECIFHKKQIHPASRLWQSVLTKPWLKKLRKQMTMLIRNQFTEKQRKTFSTLPSRDRHKK